MKALEGGWLARLLVSIFDRNPPARLVAERKSYTAVEIKRPFPTTLLGRPIQHNMTKRWSWPFVRLFGREWYFPSMLDVWRKGDRVHVWFWPWANLKRWLFTRCEACGERLPYGSSPVSMLRWVHEAKSKSVMLGEAGCYHWGCQSKPDPAADYSATDMWDRQWGHDDGLRRHVLNEPIDVALELSMLAQARRDADQRYRRRLHETRRDLGCESFVWKLPKEREEAQNAA